jgi:flagellin-like protein
MKARKLLSKKAISPIIATLLLILIAIAAGVVVYAYVLGFVGNSTGNSGGNVDTLSIDQLTLSSSSTSVTATAYLRNKGPAAESFNTGFYITGSSLNQQLAPAVSISTSTSYFKTISSVTLGYTSSTVISVSIGGLSCNAAGGTLSIILFGITAGSVSGTCPSTAGTITASVTLPPGYAITSNFAASESGIAAFPASLSALNPATIVVGTPITAGTISVPVNNVITLGLAGAGLLVPSGAGAGQFNEPLSAGSTYSVQITGTDSATTSLGAKSS